MKKTTVILYTALLLSATSIFKKSFALPNNCNAVIKTLTVNGVTSTYNYEMPTGQGKLISIVRTNGSSVTYDYTTMPGKVKETTVNPPAAPVIIIYTLNGAGLPESDNRGTGVAGSPYTYKYNPTGHPVKSVFPGYTDHRSYTSGNMTREWQTGNADPGTFIITYTTHCNTYNRNGILGKMDKDWLLKITGTYPSGTNNFVTDFTYGFDGSGRVNQQTQITNGNSTVLTFTYY